METRDKWARTMDEEGPDWEDDRSVGPQRSASCRVRRCSSEMKLDNQVDHFELFCLQAGTPKRKLSTCQEYGGSMPCLAKEEDRPNLAKEVLRRHGTVKGTMSLPISRQQQNRASQKSGRSQPSSPSPAQSPCSLRRTRSGKLWSSFKSLLDFESKKACASAPSSPTTKKALGANTSHSRSQSLRRSRRNRFVDLEDDTIRPRTSSMPTRNSMKRPNSLKIEKTAQPCENSEDGYRIRNFAITPKGIINRGDSFRSRESIRSIGSSGNGSLLGAGSHGSGPWDSSECPTHRVVISGSAGVGKTTLAHQFLTSECISELGQIEDEEQTMSVTVLLDSREVKLTLVDLSYEEHHSLVNNVDAYVIVFSTADRISFQHAVDLLYNIRLEEKDEESVVLLVANKTDLVRIRQVAAQEGKSAAQTYNCKYAEVSALMNMNVDQLLAGIVKQIRLRRDDHSQINAEDRRSPVAFLGRLLKKQLTETKSCDNLFVM